MTELLRNLTDVVFWHIFLFVMYVIVETELLLIHFNAGFSEGRFHGRSAFRQLQQTGPLLEYITLNFNAHLQRAQVQQILLSTVPRW